MNEEGRRSFVRSMTGDDAKLMLAHLSGYDPAAFDEAMSVLAQLCVYCGQRAYLTRLGCQACGTATVEDIGGRLDRLIDRHRSNGEPAILFVRHMECASSDCAVCSMCGSHVLDTDDYECRKHGRLLMLAGGPSTALAGGDEQ